MSNQLTDKIIMIRPKSFGFNNETESSNKFQKNKPEIDEKDISLKALIEFDAMVEKLRAHKIEVTVFEDLNGVKLPDSVFPNNWISTHEDGSLFTYPMQALIRRQERREDIIQSIFETYTINKRYSLELFEIQNQFLEGTGSMVLNREAKIAYACLSPRTDIRVLHKFSLLSGYQIVHFKAKDKNRFEIYHTNVLMALGKDFVVCCLQAIEDDDRQFVIDSFYKTEKEIIDISFEQMEHFAGNMLELKNSEGKRYLILSETAFNSLNQAQISTLNSHTTLLTVAIPTIEEIGGGSARCMIAEIFLPALQ